MLRVQVTLALNEPCKGSTRLGVAQIARVSRAALGLPAKGRTGRIAVDGKRAYDYLALVRADHLAAAVALLHAGHARRRLHLKLPQRQAEGAFLLLKPPPGAVQAR